MNANEKVQALNEAMAQIENLSKKNRKSQEFLDWKANLEMLVRNLFGEESAQIRKITGIEYVDAFSILRDEINGDPEYLAGLSKAKSEIQALINEIELFEQKKGDVIMIQNGKCKKIFISHSSINREYVLALADLLVEGIGIKHEQIFCSSIPEYGVGLGEDFLDFIKNELDDNIVVLFILSKEFYESRVCLCEMGATWVKANKYVPVLIPPMEYRDISGVIKPTTRSMMINNEDDLELLREYIETNVEITSNVPSTTWNRKKRTYLNVVEQEISKNESQAVDDGIGNVDYKKVILKLVRKQPQITTGEVYEYLRVHYMGDTSEWDMYDIRDILVQIENEGKISQIKTLGMNVEDVIWMPRI